MRVSLGSLSSICVVLAGFQFAGCASSQASHVSSGDSSSHSDTEKSAHSSRSYALTAHASGRGVFMSDNGQNYAEFWIHGTYSHSWQPPKKLSLLHVDVYGASGTLSASQLAVPSNFILSLPLAANERSWHLLPSEFPHSKTNWVSGQPYSLLFRTVYQVDDGGVVVQDIADIVRKVSTPSAQSSILAQFASGGGDNIATVVAHGTFTLGPPTGQSLYDVNLTYTPPGSALVEIFAGPADPMTGSPPQNLIPPDGAPNPEASPYFITNAITDPGTSGWTATGLEGPYDGTSTKYFIGIRVTTNYDTSTPDQPARRVGALNNIQAQPAQPIQP